MPSVRKNQRILGQVFVAVIGCAFFIFLFCDQNECSANKSKKDAQRLYLEIRRKFPDIKYISTEELAGLLKKPDNHLPILLDAREAEEYQVSHLASALHAATPEQARDILRDVDRGYPIVAYCSVGYRSASMARTLQKMGYTNVRNLEGSIFAWVNEGREVFRDGKPVQEVHPYDKNWGKFLDEQYTTY